MPTKKAAAPSRPPRERPLVAPGRVKREDRVIIAFEAGASQRRWTVLLRPFLLLPHLLWSALLAVGTVVVLVMAWFGALFTGRVPDGLAAFLSNVLQYQTRVLGYGPLLLTDDYPRFSLGDLGHTIAVDTAPGPLNKAAVLFRPVLMIPSVTLAFVVMLGAEVAGIVGWLVTFVLGRMPQPMLQANASVLRYVTRANAFAFMLTAEQPTSLFRGDQAFRPLGGGFDSPEQDVPVIPQWPYEMRVVLSRGAKRLLAAFVVLGALGTVGYTVGAAALVSSGPESSNRYEVLRDAHDDLAAALNRFNSEVRACAGEAQLACLHEADTGFASAFDAFAVSASTLGASAASDTAMLLVNARSCATALRARAVSINAAAYDAALPQVRAALVAFDRAYADLVQ